MRRFLLILFPVLVLSVLSACGEKAPPAKTGDTEVKAPAPAGPDLLAKAMEKATAEDMNVLVEYYDATCQFCTQMDEEVYPDDFVQELLGYLVYVRLERGKNAKPFQDRWGNPPTPTFVVLKPDGTQVGEAKTGFIDVDGMTEFIDWAAMADGDMPEISTGGS